MAQRYRVYVVPRAWKEMKSLPGYVRHRVKKSVDAFAEDPRPSKSGELSQSVSAREARRLRIENWRVVYAVSDEDELVDVVAVRKRPPYNYEDLAELIGKLL